MHGARRSGEGEGGYLARPAVAVCGEAADVDEEAPPRGARTSPSTKIDLTRRGLDEDVADGHEQEEKKAVDLGAREGQVAAGSARKVFLMVYAEDIRDAGVCKQAAPT
jgi:hypothetical protein